MLICRDLVETKDQVISRVLDSLARSFFLGWLVAVGPDKIPDSCPSLPDRKLSRQPSLRLPATDRPNWFPFVEINKATGTLFSVKLFCVRLPYVCRRDILKLQALN